MGQLMGHRRAVASAAGEFGEIALISMRSKVPSPIV
jgi:hypothetical protein